MIKVIEEFEYEGTWWLPNKPENRLNGTLSFSPKEGKQLELTGSFYKTFEKDRQIEIINGNSIDGKKITLYKSIESTRIFVPGSKISSFRPFIIFIGAHFQNEEDIKFKSLSFNFNYLDEWVNISGFDIENPNNNHELSIKYKRPEPIEATINDEYKLHIDFEYIPPTQSIMQKEAFIKQEVYIKAEFPKDESYEKYLDIIIPRFRNFLSFAVMEPVNILHIKNGKTDINKTTKNGKDTYNSFVEVFYNVNFNSENIKNKLYYNDMLFNYKDISGRLDFFLNNWFKRHDDLKKIYNLYFATIYNSDMYLEGTFLFLTQAIESFHRCVNDGTYMTDEEYKKVRKTLEKAIPPNIESSHKDALKNKIKYGNEYSLHKRLVEIFEDYKEILELFVANDEIFFRKVVDTRNYLTHYTKELYEKAAHGDELIILTLKVRILIEIILLNELGFNKDDIRRHLKNSVNIKRLKYYNLDNLIKKRTKS